MRVVQDPAGNVIRQWKNIKGGNTGVVELSMPTSTKPPLGNWAIDVSTLVSSAIAYTHMYIYIFGYYSISYSVLVYVRCFTEKVPEAICTNSSY